MFYQLPPAGNSIVVSSGGLSRGDIEQIWPPFTVRWYGSGTSALAAAVSAAVAKRAVQTPEVLVPAYGCPDVVSAVLFAGARPVLIDLVPRRPWLDLEAIERRISRDTVAIIAINFLGIQERVERLQTLAAAAGAVLIEDCAQAFPFESEEVAALRGDLVVLSFGRGKPVSLLGGGAVLSRVTELSRLLPEVSGRVSGFGARAHFRLRAIAYNLFRQPRIYWLLTSLPFLGLGTTVFKPHTEIEPAPISIDSLGANVKRYQCASDTQRRLRDALRPLVHENLVDLAEACGNRDHARLLRYPLLLDAAVCARVDAAMRRVGLGSSRLYQRAMPELPGIPDSVRQQGDFPNARRFAESLLTLPTHSHVKQRDIDCMAAILHRELERSQL